MILSSEKIVSRSKESTADILQEGVPESEGIGNYSNHQASGSEFAWTFKDSSASVTISQRLSSDLRLSFDLENMACMAFMCKDQANKATPIRDLEDADSFETRASVKLSMQYFNNGSLLRVILLRTNNLGLHRGSLYTRVTLYTDEQEKSTQSSKLVKASQQTKLNDEILFYNNEISNDATWKLRVRVYYKRCMLARRKCVGETCLSLNRLDLFLNTTCWCLLRPKAERNKELVCAAEDVQVLSRDRSIHAYATVSVSSKGLFPNSTSSLKRTNSNSRHGRRYAI